MPKPLHRSPTCNGEPFLTCGSWAPRIIYLEHIGDLGCSFSIYYNVICRFKLQLKKNIFSTFKGILEFVNSFFCVIDVFSVTQGVF